MATRRILKMSEPAKVQCLALVTPENDYRLCWLFLEYLHIQWVISAPLRLERPNRPVCEFTRYTSEQYTLLANKCENGFLLEKYKAADYLMLIEQEMSVEDTAELVKRVKTLPNLNTAFLLPLDKNLWGLLNTI